MGLDRIRKQLASRTMPQLAVSRIDTAAASRYHHHQHSPISPSGRLRLNPTTPSINTPAFGAAAPPTEVIPRLYVSDLAAAENPSVLAQLGITHVVSAMPGSIALPHTNPPLASLQIPLQDSPFAELAAHLPRATAFIADALAGDPRARVLVHCVQGISRSASIVCAYLVRVYGWTPAQAVQYVKSKRPSAEPNPGFVAQLGEFAAALQQQGHQAGRR